MSRPRAQWMMEDAEWIGAADGSASSTGEGIDLPAHKVRPAQDSEGKSEEQHVVGYLHRDDRL